MPARNPTTRARHTLVPISRSTSAALERVRTFFRCELVCVADPARGGLRLGVGARIRRVHFWVEGCARSRLLSPATVATELSPRNLKRAPRAIAGPRARVVACVALRRGSAGRCRRYMTVQRVNKVANRRWMPRMQENKGRSSIVRACATTRVRDASCCLRPLCCGVPSALTMSDTLHKDKRAHHTTPT